jgi:hypothetical protein
MAEAEDLKSSQCGFDPHSGHQHKFHLYSSKALAPSNSVIGVEAEVLNPGVLGLKLLEL